ncbi:TonB-linked SusC/RagA family outer membrane protein [Pedobacter sp. AK017]|uniref:SusC/RagA family TonB-linked outer membrane protein n=1 Tax=Pedobacter sp. AK017 TaxID=2723073 RepID=UPI00161A38E9|nr:SusC/RagA family TonB-linked outer membrane protein [Pedobacter sp. AK017]MBB5441269.1 TonB-linked SusC/RagA family outer membrane protein [Pedobacter sp. AK017]
MKFFTYGNFRAHEKARNISWLKGLDPTIKRMIIMRINLVAFLISITIMNVCASVHAQSVSLNFKQASLTDVLSAIKKQSGFQFLYNNSEIKNAKPVSVTIKDAVLKDALDQAFKDQPLHYQILDKTIVVKEQNPSMINRLSDFIKRIFITGKISNEQGKPMPGVSIKIKGKTTTAISGSAGEYRIDGQAGDVLVFSYVGYETQEISLSSQNSINIVLKEGNNELDQLQVIGYGTTTRRLSTGSVGSVKAEIIAQQQITNPLIALQGRVPGLQITQTSGLPGASVKVQIRGRNSIAANNNPLYVIDGVPFTSTPLERIGGINNTGAVEPDYSSPLNTISPNDIESIDILKDADATAIYGSRAANGVVLITTKRGKSGKIKLDASLKHGVGQVTRKRKMLNTQQFLQFRRDAFTNSNITPTAANAPELFTWDQNADFDWQDWYIGGKPRTTDASLSLSGGSEQLTFLLGGNYHHEGTILPGSTHYNRSGFHSSINYRSKDSRFNLSSNLFFTSDDNKLSGSASGEPFLASIVRQAPNYPIYDDLGNYYWAPGKTNWVAQSEATNMNKTENLNASLNLSYEVVRGLFIKANAGYNSIQGYQNNQVPIIARSPANAAAGGTSNFANNAIKTFLFEPQLSYSSTIGEGKLDVLAGTTLQQSNTRGQSIFLQGYTNDLLLGNIGFGVVSRQNSTMIQYNFLSVFGRLTYNWNEKYILNVTGRRDGSTRFGPGRQFGNFGSIGAAWLFGNESFIKETFPWLSFGKLRASYGTTGNDGIGDYGYLSLYTNSINYGNTLAIAPSQIGNDNYQWEINKKLEASLDFGFLNDRILFSPTWYRNRSGNQLVGYPLPAITGFASYNANLGAVVQNSGWEFELSTKNIRGNKFSWDSGINITIPRNKLVAFPNLDQSSYADSYVIGEPLSIIQAFHYTGTDPANGNPTVLDVNGDGNIVSSSFYNNRGGDYIIVGKTAPDWYGGFNNTIKYKNFQLDCFFLYTKQQGYNTYKRMGNFGSGSNATNVWTDALNYWKQAGDIDVIQKPLANSTSLQGRFNSSDIGISDASFLRLKTLSLAYHLPQSTLSALKLGDCKVFVQGQNILTVTKLKGYDPENANVPALVVPLLRQWAAGIQCTF